MTWMTYFCTTNAEGYNTKSKKTTVYQNIPSANRSVTCNETFLVPFPPTNLEGILFDSKSDHENNTESNFILLKGKIFYYPLCTLKWV